MNPVHVMLGHAPATRRMCKEEHNNKLCNWSWRTLRRLKAGLQPESQLKEKEEDTGGFNGNLWNCGAVKGATATQDRIPTREPSVRGRRILTSKKRRCQLRAPPRPEKRKYGDPDRSPRRGSSAIQAVKDTALLSGRQPDVHSKGLINITWGINHTVIGAQINYCRAQALHLTSAKSQGAGRWSGDGVWTCRHRPARPEADQSRQLELRESRLRILNVCTCHER